MLKVEGEQAPARGDFAAGQKSSTRRARSSRTGIGDFAETGRAASKQLHIFQRFSEHPSEVHASSLVAEAVCGSQLSMAQSEHNTIHTSLVQTASPCRIFAPDVQTACRLGHWASTYVDRLGDFESRASLQSSEVQLGTHRLARRLARAACARLSSTLAYEGDPRVVRQLLVGRSDRDMRTEHADRSFRLSRRARTRLWRTRWCCDPFVLCYRVSMHKLRASRTAIHRKATQIAPRLQPDLSDARTRDARSRRTQPLPSVL